MKLKLIPRSHLVSAQGEAPSTVPFEPSQTPVDQRRERLYRAIERTYAFMHKSADAGEFMRAVRRRYPAPLYFIESNGPALERAGLSRLDAFYYSMIPHLTRTSLSQQWGSRPRLDALGRCGEYARTLFVGMHVECFYAILLDRRGRLIRSALLQRGDADNTPFYLRQLMTVALQEGARFLVLAHNHPGGTKRPSREDLECTLRALSAFMPLRIPLLDHIIVAGESVVSIRGLGLLSGMLWTAAMPGNRIVEGWLDDET